MAALDKYGFISKNTVQTPIITAPFVLTALI